MHRNYPDCPECESNIPVDRCSTLNDYKCRDCGTSFDAEKLATPDGRRPEWVISR